MRLKPCNECGQDVDLDGHYYFHAEGYAPHRSGGGVNQLAGMRKTGPVYHPHCVELRIKGFVDTPLPL